MAYDISPYAADRNAAELSGIELQRAALTNTTIAVEKERLPSGFPFHLWEEQQKRYRHNWDWFTGYILNENKGTTRTGETIYKYPLKINTVRNFSRKHAALLFGEIPEHSHRPLIKCMMRPINMEMEDVQEPEVPEAPKPSPTNPTGTPFPKPRQKATPDPRKAEAKFYANVVNRVFTQSGCDAIFMENGTLSQFLGGSYLTLNYVPWRKDLAVPIVIRNPKPDFVLPIWTNDDPWDLLEAYIVYRMPSKSAELEWGFKNEGNLSATWVTYVEHWTKTHHSIYLDGKPLTATYLVDGVKTTITYNQQKNLFGFVPVYYIPRLRETGFYGSDLVVDIEGLTLELNGRMADTGTAMMNTAHRKWLGRNISQTIRQKQLDNGQFYTDLGMENPAAKHPPELWPEDPPKWSETMTTFIDTIWEQLLREGSLTPVAFGEDEGSQRSALTLAIRFWPTTVLAKSQRVFWTQGLIRLAQGIFTMLNKTNTKVAKEEIPDDVMANFDVEMDWLPMVPRDREQTVNESVLLSSISPIPRMSLRRSLENLGDIRDIEEEMEAIFDDMEHAGAQAAQQQAQMAQTEIQSPVASDGLSDE
jgi:hypothetical protein